MNGDALFKILLTVAPTVAPKIIEAFSNADGKKINERTVNTVLTAMMVEQNNHIVSSVDAVNNKLSKTAEDVTIILKRTESLAKVR